MEAGPWHLKGPVCRLLMLCAWSWWVGVPDTPPVLGPSPRSSRAAVNILESTFSGSHSPPPGDGSPGQGPPMLGVEPGEVLRLAQGHAVLVQGHAVHREPELAFHPLLPQIETLMYKASHFTHTVCGSRSSLQCPGRGGCADEPSLCS